MENTVCCIHGAKSLKQLCVSILSRNVKLTLGEEALGGGGDVKLTPRFFGFKGLLLDRLSKVSVQLFFVR